MGVSDRLNELEEALGNAHGCVFFSPTKGYHCDLLCQDRKKSWVTGTGESITEAVEKALALKKELECIAAS